MHETQWKIKTISLFFISENEWKKLNWQKEMLKMEESEWKEIQEKKNSPWMKKKQTFFMCEKK